VSELHVTLEKSAIGNPQDQKDTVRLLGLTRLHKTVTLPDTPSIRGMLHKVRHLIRVHSVEESGVQS
jgi:large subunit ribosomal protein L30